VVHNCPQPRSKHSNALVFMSESLCMRPKDSFRVAASTVSVSCCPLDHVAAPRFKVEQCYSSQSVIYKMKSKYWSKTLETLHLIFNTVFNDRNQPRSKAKLVQNTFYRNSACSESVLDEARKRNQTHKIITRSQSLVS